MLDNSIKEIKAELIHLDKNELIELLLTTGKFKKENKEFLNYLLFHKHDSISFSKHVKDYISVEVAGFHPIQNLYYTKKSLRKVLRMISKYCKFSKDKALETEWRLHLLLSLKENKIPLKSGSVLQGIFDKELEKIEKLITNLHEDLQQDYLIDLEKLGWNKV